MPTGKQIYRKALTKLAQKDTTVQEEQSALEKAMQAAEKYGKPTGAGIAGGLGAGAILAALGYAARSGNKPSENSFLTNPLLLGSLGALAGYYGGNYLETGVPAEPAPDPSVISSVAGASVSPAGLATLGTAGILASVRENAKMRALNELATAEASYNAMRNSADYVHPNGGSQKIKIKAPDGTTTERTISFKDLPVDRQNAILDDTKNYSDALERAGKGDIARKLGITDKQLLDPKSNGSRLSGFVKSYKNPFSGVSLRTIGNGLKFWRPGYLNDLKAFAYPKLGPAGARFSGRAPGSIRRGLGGVGTALLTTALITALTRSSGKAEETSKD